MFAYALSSLDDEDDEPIEEPTVRLTAPRVARVCQLADDIAANPGQSRAELARRYAVSERQVQADLNFIARDIGMPLVRRQGYRFEAEPSGPRMSAEDVELLLLLLGGALGGPLAAGIPQERVRSLLKTLPSLLPPHVRPLVRVALDEHGGNQSVYGCLVRALLSGRPVRLLFAPYVRAQGDKLELRPRAIFPYRAHWQLLGQCDRTGRLEVVSLEQVVEVQDLA